MSFESMLADACSGSVEIEPGWAQGRATYGGLVGALLFAPMEAARAEVAGSEARPQPLRSLTVSFVGPVAVGPATVEADVLRAGKNVTQARASITQDGGVMAAALASFGAARESSITVAPSAEAPEMPPLDTAEPFPVVEGITPEFHKHVVLRQTGGNLPFSGADTSSMSGWTQLRETPERFTTAHFVALADAWPPSVIQMITAPAPGSSLTWTLEFVEDVDGVDPETPWIYSVTTDAARDGYAHSDARFFHPDGRLVAISRQTLTVFA